jgi:hypothetical protein
LKKTTPKPAKDGYYRVLVIPFQEKHKKLFDEVQIDWGVIEKPFAFVLLCIAAVVGYRIFKNPS